MSTGKILPKSVMNGRKPQHVKVHVT